MTPLPSNQNQQCFVVWGTPCNSTPQTTTSQTLAAVADGDHSEEIADLAPDIEAWFDVPDIISFLFGE